MKWLFLSFSPTRLYRRSGQIRGRYLFMVEPEMIPPGGEESPDPLVLPRPPRVPAEGGWPIMGPSPRPPRPPTSPVASPPPPGPPPAELGGPTGPGPPPPGGCPPPPTGYMTSVVNPDLAADPSQLPFDRGQTKAILGSEMLQPPPALLPDSAHAAFCRWQHTKMATKAKEVNLEQEQIRF